MKKRKKVAGATPIERCYRCTRELYEQHEKDAFVRFKEAMKVDMTVDGQDVTGYLCMHCVVYFLMPWLVVNNERVFGEVVLCMDEEDREWVRRVLDE